MTSEWPTKVQHVIDAVEELKLALENLSHGGGDCFMIQVEKGAHAELKSAITERAMASGDKNWLPNDALTVGGATVLPLKGPQ